ncbi:hypothetical protein ERO13_A10G159800v2 [Gossypium hirsutum]|uniref:Uncharacterized protein LOC107896722 n=1 Tax=Gossypium hirsutum TaxID=3635 RepID=A0A1U8INT8_GOSHI|nr:uncharacterized protein LOC107896722 [Gossypium hirsutum]XP_016677474.1 uncharacterized protein LOC107896722 [Gossypium hirsutum]KAG4180335.1 hypothetical protein ERO13_A10G159800v2 [Gossypium hirsutum]
MLGSSVKTRRGPTVHVDYLIHIQEIKPWPPSQSLRSVRSVLIQWENGERSSGSTKTVSPTVGSVAVEGKIEFNESFKLPVNLVKDMSIKGKDADVFMKNVLEFNLYEPRREKIQLLGTAIVDLGEYGVIKETLEDTALVNSKRSLSNTAQPILFIKIDRIYKGRNSASSSRGSLLLERKESGTVSSLMDDEYAEEAEVASFTDDDVSSHSSQTVSSSTLESNGGSHPQNEENGSVSQIDCKGDVRGASSENSVDSRASASDSYSSNSPVRDNIVIHKVHSSSSLPNDNTLDASNTSMRSDDREDLSQKVHEMVANKGTMVTCDVQSTEGTSDSSKAKMAGSAKSPQVDKLEPVDFSDSIVDGEDDRKAQRNGKASSKEASAADDAYDNSREGNSGYNWQENGHEGQYWEAKKYYTEDEQLNIHSQENSLSQGNLGTKSNALKSDRLKHVKSVRSSSDSVRSNGLVSDNQHAESKEAGVLGDVQHGPGTLMNKSSNGSKDAKVYPKDTRSAILDNKIQQLENKIMMLEGELREAAAIEAALFSIVAEHGSSMNKVHAPARRLSRLYLHACKEGFQSRRASAARSAVSGLALVAKACGNDVPRLTFWLSNSVVLRAIISESIGDMGLRLSAGPMEGNGGGKEEKHVSSPLKWIETSPGRKENKLISYGSFSDWDSPLTFISALERVEAWIFSRIIESVWWQALTPHMQSEAREEVDIGISSASGKSYGRVSSASDQDQMNFSLDHWKKAFKDACERLCPVRAAGHECGCLHLLSRLIMEHCVARLDVAMFNAVLRDSGDEIPTDPMSDPISDLLVLPVPAGKASFGAGAQLKNAIGNWSRWLTDLFGIDDEIDQDGSDERQDTSIKSFYLLNALSDLMMLPKDMLLSRHIREEVCPTFGATLIKRVLDNFVPDEFCPDPVPDVVLEALEAEDPAEAREGFVTSFPYVASPPIYSPPSATSIASIIGEVGSQSQLRRSRSSVLRKSYTSDDELDELNSPLASIFNDGFRSSPVKSKPIWISKGNNYQNAIRYELLRDVWKKSE